jgi:hypothetical protein
MSVHVLADNLTRQCQEAQLTSTRFGRSAWRCPAWRRAQPTGHPRSRFAENFWHACLLIVRLSRVRFLVRVGFDDRAELLAADPDVYYVTDHYLNYSTVLVRLSRVTPDVLLDLLGMAHKFVNAHKERRSPSRNRPKRV